jgi:hypothetical protein
VNMPILQVKLIRKTLLFAAAPSHGPSVSPALSPGANCHPRTDASDVRMSTNAKTGKCSENSTFLRRFSLLP